MTAAQVDPSNTMGQGHHLTAADPRIWLTGALVLGVIALMLLEGVPGAVAGIPAVGAPSPLGTSTGAGAAELAAASASLAAGQGPAAGQSLTCTPSSSGGQTSCSSTTTTSTSPGNIGSQKWESEVAPSARAGAVMTYDGKDRYVLLFGGANGSSYMADTWEFSHSMWVQLSPGVSPSPRANAS